MRPLLLLGCLLTLGLGSRSAFASATNPADTLSIHTVDDSVRSYSTVEPWPGEFVRATREGGTTEFVPVHRIRWIRAGETDVTDLVLVDRRKVPLSDPRKLEEVRAAQQPVTVPESYKAPALRGRPLPWDRAFPIIQGGLLLGLNDHNPYAAAEGVAIADVGYMRNVSPKTAVGATFSLVGDQDYARVGFKPRLRQWISKTRSIDFAAGAFYCVDDTTGDVDHSGLGFVGEASLTFGDFIAVTTLLEFSNVDERVNWGPYLDPHFSSGPEFVSYFGIKAGGEPGIPAAILMGLAAISLREIAGLN